jgi:hypothetical protein
VFFGQEETKQKHNSQKKTVFEMLHVFLDVHGTLVSEDERYVRPHLKLFLKTLFETCTTVSIWTATSRENFDAIFNKHIRECMPCPNQKFFRIYSHTNNSYCIEQKRLAEFGGCYNDERPFKRLKNRWNKALNINRRNTIIIDNNPFTYHENYGNAIPIKTFNCDSKEDCELLKLIDSIQMLKDSDDVRRTNRILFM